MIQALVIGAILGVATALSPRPVLPLIVGEVVRYGLWSGLAGLIGAFIGDSLLAAGLAGITLLLGQAGLVALIAAELIAAIGLFYLTYQLGISLPTVQTLAVEDVSERVGLGHWPGWTGIRRGALASLGSATSWALWMLAGTALALSLPERAALPWLIGGWLAASLLTQSGILVAAGHGALHLDTGLLRGVTIFAVAVFWLSGIFLLTTAVRELMGLSGR
ncbi:MAG TPA: hypothetical protein VHL09_12835 [Dehalococcoidia bacterium]|nr:hypothetical protein [Dehalococcoidia bacterium]